MPAGLAAGRCSPVTTDPHGHHMHRLANTSFQPVFILGMPRSGTSVLYRILHKTERFNVVTLYHVLYHDRLLHHHLNGGKKAAIQEIAEYFEGMA